jgi:hypothetical protein
VLGIAAFVLAVLIFLALPVAMVVVNQPDFLSEASTISSRVVAGQLVAMIVAAGLGIAAMITRRGRGWGIAALGILVGLLVLGLLLPLIFSLAAA